MEKENWIDNYNNDKAYKASIKAKEHKIKSQWPKIIFAIKVNANNANEHCTFYEEIYPENIKRLKALGYKLRPGHIPYMNYITWGEEIDPDKVIRTDPLSIKEGYNLQHIVPIVAMLLIFAFTFFIVWATGCCCDFN